MLATTAFDITDQPILDDAGNPPCITLPISNVHPVGCVCLQSNNADLANGDLGAFTPRDDAGRQTSPTAELTVLSWELKWSLQGRMCGLVQAVPVADCYCSAASALKTSKELRELRWRCRLKVL